MLEGCLGETAVVALLEGRLSKTELSEIEAHMDRCAECRVLVSSLVERDPSDSTEPGLEVAPTLLAATVFDPNTPDSFDRDDVPGVPALNVGETLAQRFVVLHQVGKGGMGEVFRARDGSSGDDVAVKVTAASSGGDAARFEREAELLLRLDHPAIVRHVAHGRAEDGKPFLAMQWLEGEDLAVHLRRERLSIEDIVKIATRVAGALAAAHAVGVVHRDVKPSNIFLAGGRPDHAMLIDFGVARSPWRGAASLSTRTGTLLGTLGYMAPEQAIGAKTVDGRADIFSLGCVLFECLTGERLFAGEHAVEILAKLLTDPIRAPSALVANLPPALDDLVVRMLSRDVSRRPETCAAVVVELETIQATGGRSVVRTDLPVAESRARRGAFWAVVASAVLASAAFVALRAGPRSPALSTDVAPFPPTASPASTPRESPARGVEPLRQVTAAAVPSSGAPPSPRTSANPLPLAPTDPRSRSRSRSRPGSSAAPGSPSSSPAPDPFGTSRN